MYGGTSANSLITWIKAYLYTATARGTGLKRNIKDQFGRILSGQSDPNKANGARKADPNKNWEARVRKSPSTPSASTASSSALKSMKKENIQIE